MNATGLAAFVAMGGYGAYVWGAFGVAALVMAGEMLALRARRRAAARAFDAEADDATRRGGHPGDAMRQSDAALPGTVEAPAALAASVRPATVRVEYREGTA